MPRPDRPITSSTRSTTVAPVRPIHLLGLLVVAVLVFTPALNGRFVWDDHALLQSNEQIRHPGNLPAAFGIHAFAGVDARGDRFVEYYRPIWIAALTLGGSAWGANPLGFHLLSIALHVIVTWLVHLALLELAVDPTAALIGALVFAVHPVHAEAVAWASASNEPLVAAWSLLALILFLRSNGRFSRTALGVYALALLTKESAVALPLLLALCAAGRSGAGAIARRVAPFVALAIGYLLVRRLVVHPHPDSREFFTRFLTAPRVLAEYLRLLFLPWRMRVFHDVPIVDRPLGAAFLVPMAALVAWSLAAARWRRGAPIACTGMLWPLLALLPLCGIAGFPQPAILAERYLYLPSVGVALFVAGAVQSLRARSTTTGVAAGAAALLASMFLAIGTFAQTRVWHDDVSLMTRMVADAPGVVTGHANLGVALERAGRLADAEVQDSIAVVLAPGDVLWRHNLAIVLAKRGRLAEARREFDMAQRLRPDAAGAQEDAIWLSSLRSGRQSMEEYRLTLRREPGNVAALIGLGRALLAEGQVGAAADTLRVALRLQPESSEAHRQLSAVFDRQGLGEGALREDSLATAYDSGSADAHYDYGVELSARGRVDEALAQFRAAARLRPEWAKAHFNVGAILANTGDRRGALAELRRALELAPPDSALEAHARDAIRSLNGR
jgi:protein O-mannosyl-transferase